MSRDKDPTEEKEERDFLNVPNTTTTVKQENWNIQGKKVPYITIRRKGKLIASKQLKKGESIEQLRDHFKVSGSLNLNVSSREKFSTGLVKTVTTKKPKRHTGQMQVMAIVKIIFRKNEQTFVGFSDKGEINKKGKDQAFNNAIKIAIVQGFIKYNQKSRASFQTEFRYINYR